MNIAKKGQLAFIEFKFFLFGLALGLVLGYTSVILGTKKVIPFEIPLVCGFMKNKGQLAGIEFHFFWIGGVIGIGLMWVLIYLGTVGIIPFKMPLACPSK